MWDNRVFWQRLLATLLTATKEGRVEWAETPEEPTYRAIFGDGKIFLMLPEGGGWPPEVVAFDRWLDQVGVFRPEQPEELALVEQLYRLAERKHRAYEDLLPLVARAGEMVVLEPVLRSIEAEVTRGSGAVATNARR